MTPGTSTSQWARRRPCAAASGPLGLPGDQFILLAPFFTEYTYFITGDGGEPVVVPAGLRYLSARPGRPGAGHHLPHQSGSGNSPTIPPAWSIPPRP